MASWRTKRKATYMGIFIAAVLLLVVLPLFLVFYKAPTCYDHIQNAAEAGVDCGGGCAKICAVDFLSPNILWARSQNISHGVYNLGAYVENPNLEGAATNVQYLFKLYDKDGLLITQRRGSTYLPPHKNVLVFEPSVVTSERTPAHVTFEFTDAIDWNKVVQSQEYLIAVDKKFSTIANAPRLEAQIQNRSVSAISNIDVVGILYDSDDNTMGFSKTKIDSLGGGQTAPAIFTWPLPFDREVSRIEIIPTIQP